MQKIGHFDYDKRNFLKTSWQVNFYTLLVGSKLLLVYNISVQNKYKLINEWIKSHDIWKSGISLRWPIQLGTDLKKFCCCYFSFPICTQSNTDWSVTASDGNLAVESWSTFCPLPTARFEQKVGPLDAVTERLWPAFNVIHWLTINRPIPYGVCNVSDPCILNVFY